MGFATDALKWGTGKVNDKLEYAASNKLPRLQAQNPPVALLPGFIAHNQDLLTFVKEEKSIKDYVRR